MQVALAHAVVAAPDLDISIPVTEAPQEKLPSEPVQVPISAKPKVRDPLAARLKLILVAAVAPPVTLIAVAVVVEPVIVTESMAVCAAPDCEATRVTGFVLPGITVGGV